MRKNLHYKVLASVLAIAGLYFYNAPAAWADFKNTTEYSAVWIGTGEINGNDKIPATASVYGWHAQYPSYGDSTKKANNNIITISGSKLSNVCGGVGADETANGNEITINNSNIYFITGGSSYNGMASGNKVIINGENNIFNSVEGGTTDDGTATGNIVTINGNVEASDFIAGGVGEAGYSKVYGNQVIIQSGTVTSNIYGGYINSEYPDSN